MTGAIITLAPAATGSSSEETLRAAGAELVLRDLTDTDAVVGAVLQVSAA